MELEKFCRLCGVNAGKSMYSIFSKNSTGQQLIQLIKQCLPILIYRSDPLSKVICEKCYKKLNEFNTFRCNTIELHEQFKTKLEDVNSKSAELYIHTLENNCQFEYITSPVHQNNRPRTSRASQIKVETRTYSTNTENSANISTKTLKILTPNKINQTCENISISLQSKDGTIVKKRKLLEPKPQTRITCNPKTLLQCALKQINVNLNLIEKKQNEEIMEKQEYEDSEGDCDAGEELILPSFSLMEPRIDISVLDENIDTESYNYDFINLTEPVICNYCMKKFDNIMDLAAHELQHIKVDIGPKVDSKDFLIRCRKYSSYYNNYLARMQSEDQIPVKLPVPVKKVLVESEESLLIPKISNNEHVFKIVNNEIMINGIPLKSMSKKDRRECYKTITVNGTKRKFCTLCRHTFKDSWAMENHYFNNICLFTCKYCGRRFKYQQDLLDEHLKIHKGETLNKVFGPTNKFKKKKLMTSSRSFLGGNMLNVNQKVKPLKMKHFVPKKIKTEPKHSTENPNSVSLEPSSSKNELYQAYFCRKCFKVFFNVNEYNSHILICTGRFKNTETSSISSDGHSKRPIRSCVKERTSLNDSDVDSDDFSAKRSSKVPVKIEEWKCGVCCCSFPSRQSRNSHMRIHKQGQGQPKPILIKNQTKSQTVAKPEPQEANTDIRLENLNPVVARLVQNNPHLTIRSYSKSQKPPVEKPPEIIEPVEIRPSTEPAPSMNESISEHNIKRVYKCANCEDRFENKSVLYYHKMNSCIFKKHYECAFCRKKFGTYDQYNTHMFFVHPE